MKKWAIWIGLLFDYITNLSSYKSPCIINDKKNPLTINSNLFLCLICKGIKNSSKKALNIQ